MSHNSALTFSEADLLASVPARFQHVLAQTPPDRLAYISADERRTYHELATASRQLAAVLVALLDRGTSRPTQKAVALLLPPYGADALVGMMGTLEAGHFYVPLDFVMGEAMLRDILLECVPQAIVTTTTLRERLTAILPAGQNPPVLCLDALPTNPAQFSIAPPADDQMLASIQYTSGSTGRPRGVMRTHASNLYASYLAHHDLDFMPGARIAHLRSYAYGASQQPIFGGILNGATLHSLPLPDVTPSALYQWIVDWEVTHLYVSLGLLRGLADLSEAHPPLTSLRVIMTGGEPLYCSDVERLYRLLSPTCKIVARLVSTETSIYARFVIQADTNWPGDAVPGGYVASGSQVMILDENRQALPAGEVGEIAVRSRFLAAGYWQRPEETAARFLPDPDGGEARIFLTGDMGRMNADGCLEMVGRKDFMVKIRGYRMELQAIEAALQTQPDVRDSVVVAQPGRDGEMRLIAYVVPGKQPSLSVTGLRQALARTLPHYMIPARFVFVDHLARKENSKVDRSILPPASAARPNLSTPFVAPRSEPERQIAAIWADLLELDEVGVADNFFELGGDSILAMQMKLRIEKLFQKQMPSSYFQKATIVALIELLASETTTTDAPLTRPLVSASLPISWPHRIGRLLSGKTSVNTVLRRVPVEIALRLTYRQGVRWLAWWSSLPLVQAQLYRTEHDLFRQFAEAVGQSDALNTRFQISMLNILVRQCYQQWLGGKRLLPVETVAAMAKSRYLFWRSFANYVQHASATDREHLITFSGLGYLQRSQAQGRGTILITYHCPISPIADAMLAGFIGVGPVVLSQAVASRLARAEEPQFMSVLKARKSAWGTVLSSEALSYLTGGGTVIIANDIGYDQASTVEQWVAGRLYQLKPGFIELALTSGAMIIPVYSSCEKNGSIRMTFLTPFEWPSDQNDTNNTHNLMAQYAHFLEHAWHTDLESVSWHTIHGHLAHPIGGPVQSV